MIFEKTPTLKVNGRPVDEWMLGKVGENWSVYDSRMEEKGYMPVRPAGYGEGEEDRHD